MIVQDEIQRITDARDDIASAVGAEIGSKLDTLADAARQLVPNYINSVRFSDVVVAASEFVSDATYSDYPLRAAIALNGVTAASDPDVLFGEEDQDSGLYSPTAETYNGGVYIYANAIPTSAVTIPRIICWKE